MARVLLTTTSFQDTPGPHHRQLQDAGIELVTARGPLGEADMLKRVGDVDAILCGDDDITRAVLERALPRLKALSKYGIGVDRIDVEAATALGIPLAFTPGVNHTTVAEHVFLLMLSLAKNLVEEANYTRAGNWKRLIGHEIMGKTLGIIGLGRIGKEVAVRAAAFGMPMVAYGAYWDEDFARKYGVKRAASVAEVLAASDVVTLNTNLNDSTRNLINKESLELMRPGAVIVNCARGGLIDTRAVVAALESGRLAGYAADVLEEEPPPPDHPLLKAPHCIITPHIGSRTHESVQRQAGMAAANLLRMLKGEKPLAQVNESVPVRA